VLLALIAARWGSRDTVGGFVDAAAIAGLTCSAGWSAAWYLQATQQLHDWARVELVVYALLIVGCIVFATSLYSYVVLQVVALSALLCGFALYLGSSVGGGRECYPPLGTRGATWVCRRPHCSCHGRGAPPCA